MNVLQLFHIVAHITNEAPAQSRPTWRDATQKTDQIIAIEQSLYYKDSLEASEEALREILREDPLLFRKYKSTKGLKGKNVSFDDRSYVKLRLNALEQGDFR